MNVKTYFFSLCTVITDCNLYWTCVCVCVFVFVCVRSVRIDMSLVEVVCVSVHSYVKAIAWLDQQKHKTIKLKHSREICNDRAMELPAKQTYFQTRTPQISIPKIIYLDLCVLWQCRTRSMLQCSVFAVCIMNVQLHIWWNSQSLQQKRAYSSGESEKTATLVWKLAIVWSRDRTFGFAGSADERDFTNHSSYPSLLLLNFYIFCCCFFLQCVCLSAIFIA